MTLEEAVKNYLLIKIIYNGEQLNFGRKNKNFDEWFEKHKQVKGKVGIWQEQLMINTVSILVFYIDKGELEELK